MTRGCALSQLLCYHRFCVWKTLQSFWPGGGEGKSDQEREVGWGRGGRLLYYLCLLVESYNICTAVDLYSQLDTFLSSR